MLTWFQDEGSEPGRDQVKQLETTKDILWWEYGTRWVPNTLPRKKSNHTRGKIILNAYFIPRVLHPTEMGLA